MAELMVPDEYEESAPKRGLSGNAMNTCSCDGGMPSVANYPIF